MLLILYSLDSSSTDKKQALVTMLVSSSNVKLVSSLIHDVYNLTIPDA